MSNDKTTGKAKGASRNSHNVKILINDYCGQDLQGLLIMAKSIERMAGWLRGLEPPKQKKLLILCKLISAECHNSWKEDFTFVLHIKKNPENPSNLESKYSNVLIFCTPK